MVWFSDKSYIRYASLMCVVPTVSAVPLYALRNRSFESRDSCAKLHQYPILSLFATYPFCFQLTCLLNNRTKACGITCHFRRLLSMSPPLWLSSSNCHSSLEAANKHYINFSVVCFSVHPYFIAASKQLSCFFMGELDGLW
jgi:hypothetical protein